MARLGSFDPLLDPRSWFDETSRPEGWFDEQLIPNPSGGGNSQALAITLDGVTVAIAQTADHSQALAATLDDVTALINQSVTGAANSQALAITLDGVTAEIQQTNSAVATRNGAVPAWNPYRKTGETEEQKHARRIAQGIIQKAKEPEADIPALFEEAKEVSAFLQADIQRLERQANEYQALLEKRKTKLRTEAYMSAQNDILATRQLQQELIQIQLQAEAHAALIEELDVVFMVVMLAAL